MSKAAKPGDKNADPKKDDPKNDPKGQGKGGDSKDAKGKSQLEVKELKMDGKGKGDAKDLKSPKGDNKASPRHDSEDRKPEKNIIHKIFIEAPPPEKEDRKHALENSGILDAYAHLLQEFCKYGLPKGNVFEFAAVSILKYERKMKAEKANKLHAQNAVEGIEKYKELYRHRSVEAGIKERDRSDSPQRGKKDRSESPQRNKKDRERSESPEKGKDGKDKKGDPKKDDKKDPKAADKKDEKNAKDDKNKKPADDKNAKVDPKASAAKPDAKGKEAPKVEEKKDDKKAKK